MMADSTATSSDAGELHFHVHQNGSLADEHALGLHASVQLPGVPMTASSNQYSQYPSQVWPISHFQQPAPPPPILFQQNASYHSQGHLHRPPLSVEYNAPPGLLRPPFVAGSAMAQQFQVQHSPMFATAQGPIPQTTSNSMDLSRSGYQWPTPPQTASQIFVQSAGSSLPQSPPFPSIPSPLTLPPGYVTSQRHVVSGSPQIFQNVAVFVNPQSSQNQTSPHLVASPHQHQSKYSPQFPYQSYHSFNNLVQTHQNPPAQTHQNPLDSEKADNSVSLPSNSPPPSRKQRGSLNDLLNIFKKLMLHPRENASDRLKSVLSDLGSPPGLSSQHKRSIQQLELLERIETIASDVAEELCVDKVGPLRVSCSTGIHLGSRNPEAPPISRHFELINEGENAVLLRKAVLVPSRDEFCVELESFVSGQIENESDSREAHNRTPLDSIHSPVEIKSGDRIKVVVTGKPNVTRGVFRSWVFFACEAIHQQVDPSPDFVQSLFPKERDAFFLVGRPMILVVTPTANQFAFDVYSKPFTPQAVIAVMSSPAVVRHGIPPPQPDYANYRKHMTPPWLYTHPTPIPPLPTVNDSSPTPPPLTLKTYKSTFTNLLSHELSTRASELRQHTLYGVPITPYIPPNLNPPRLFTITVPGVTESSPHLEIGDAVRARRVVPYFDGVEYEGYVYAVVRRISCAYVRFPGLQFYGDDERWNVSFCIRNDTFGFMARALEEVERWGEKDETNARAMLFPRVEDAVKKAEKKAVGEIEAYYDASLNPEQRKAVNDIVQGDYGRVPYVIWGPPGTGKTMTLIESILQIVRTQPNAHILACAPSHSAADTITRRLIAHAHPIPAPGSQTNVDERSPGISGGFVMLRLNGPSRGFAEVPREILPFCFSSTRDGGEFFDVPQLDLLLGCNVVVCTTLDAGMLDDAGVTNHQLGEQYVKYHMHLNRQYPHLHPLPTLESRPRHWTHLFIDECGQASEAETAVPLSIVIEPPLSPIYAPFSRVKGVKGEHCQVILCGDHKQLSPLIHDDYARQGRLHVSWLERLMNRRLYRDHPESRGARREWRRRKEEGLAGLRERSVDDDEGEGEEVGNVVAPFVNLIRNYRSHPDMLVVPSKLFYSATLEANAAKSQTELLLGLSILPNATTPLAFFGVEGSDECAGETTSSAWWNSIEVEMVADTVAKILNEGEGKLAMSDVGVISPFREQVKQIRLVLRSRSLGGIDVGTVEDYQGMERRVIVISTVRSRQRFLEDDLARDLGVVHQPKRMNVLITRAMSLLVIIGNPRLLSNDPSWVSLFVHLVSIGAYVGSIPQRVAVAVARKQERKPMVEANSEGQEENESEAEEDFARRNGRSRQTSVSDETFRGRYGLINGIPVAAEIGGESILTQPSGLNRGGS
ncbi:hypothetical protein BJ742DRAFT_814821 [Cladochytrium replicatum]|nr:hypothetical protein BJ742DRAFT_814821 [Cladochytrium replicatum]